MRYYVIINGVNSLSIQGLAINKLPPISKPLMRNQIEEIDGRDGDIVTELGYSAYDKSMEIGLYGNFDIDEIIKYFTGEGTIVFSNEEDKYYNFKILDQIDYEKLLKFKTAVVTFHCQPFKYPVEETPIEGEAITITGSGSNITLENTMVAPMNVQLKGNTIQDGTPTPNSPVPVQVVSGDNSINVVGKNIIDLSTATKSGWNYVIDNPIKEAGTYTISVTQKTTKPGAVAFRNSLNDSNIGGYFAGYNFGDGILSSTKEITQEQANAKYIIWLGNGDEPLDELKSIFMLAKGTDTTYEEYKGASYPISLGYENLLDLNASPIFMQYAVKTYEEPKIKIIKTYAALSCFCLFNVGSAKDLNGKTLKLSGNCLVTGTSKGRAILGYADADGNNRVTISDSQAVGNTSIDISMVVDGTTYSTKQVVLWLYADVINNGSIGDTITYENIMINVGSTAKPYTPYGKAIELCKIGTYQDKIFKNTPNTTDYDSNLEDNVWYLKKEIGKVVLNGSENWVQSGQSTNTYRFALSQTLLQSSTEGYCNTNKYVTSGVSTDTELIGISGGTIYYRISTSLLTALDVTQFKNWLANNNSIVYAPLITPTYETITDTTLIGQLEALKPYSYNPVTNITQTNNDAPFELDVSLSYTNTMNVNNVGNIYAKPILTIEGSGTIGIILNDIEVLSVDLGTDEKITIDVPNLQAYNPDNDVLLNRNVTGDYMKLLINDGDNTIAFSGSVTSATLTNYTRYI